MAIKVAHIPDLSCEPFYFDMERRGIELVDTAPSAMAAAAEKGEIHAGPVPVVDCFRLAGSFQPLSGFCIAAINQAGTSILHSKRPIQSLAAARIGVSEDDATSLRLLQVLLAFKHQVQPEAYVGMEDSSDAFLLTGNEALRRRRGVRGYPHKYDLGQEWREWTGLPFVFYRWMVSTDMDRTDASILEDALYVGQEEWLNNLYRMSGPRNDLLMLPKDVLEHHQSLRHYVGVPEQKAIDLFHEYLSREDLNRLDPDRK